MSNYCHLLALHFYWIVTEKRLSDIDLVTWLISNWENNRKLLLYVFPILGIIFLNDSICCMLFLLSSFCVSIKAFIVVFKFIADSCICSNILVFNSDNSFLKSSFSASTLFLATLHFF